MKKLCLLPFFCLLILTACGGSDNNQEKANNLFNEALEAQYYGNTERAFELYTQAAELGHSDAQNNLGIMYLEGEVVEVDYEQANEWFKKSASQGNTYGQYNFAYSYYYGRGVNIDYEEAFNLFKASATKGHSHSQNFLGIMYETGKGVEQSYDAAILWYEKAADNENHYAQYNLGRLYENGLGVIQNYEEAYTWYLLASDSGHAIASYRIALFYYNGWYVDKSSASVLTFIQKSASQEYDEAQFLLAEKFGTGKLWGEEYEEIDLSKAEQWYERAAENGNTSAQYRLAHLNSYGLYGKSDYEYAYQLLTEIAEQDDIVGQLHLGEFYELGHLEGSDFDKAFYWYSKAELLCENNQELVNACAEVDVALGYLYQRGLGTTINYETAMQYYQQALEVNFLPAFTKIGELYLRGLGVEQDYEQAKQWFELAITETAADPGALNNIGYLYHYGLGVEKNVETAKEWYNLAIKQEIEGDLQHQDYAFALTNLGDLDGGFLAEKYYQDAAKKYKFDPQALYNLAVICEESPSCDNHIEQFELAAQAGHLESLFVLGEEQESIARRTYNSELEAEAYLQAAIYFEQAANRNHELAALKTASFYEQGIGVEVNIDNAAAFYLRAAELGNMEAQYKIGQYYLLGNSVEEDVEQALYWLEKSHLQGYTAATSSLGLIYETNIDVQDLELAYSLNQQAALLADMEAQFRLGLMYLQGRGVSENIIKGRAWLLQAATKGHLEAHQLTYSPVKAIYDNDYATAVLREDGSVITWGANNDGGDSIVVRDKLVEGVVAIHPLYYRGFAALKDDGSVFVWGEGRQDYFEPVAEELTSGVIALYGDYYAHAALKEDGSLVTWGSSDIGGDSSAVADKLSSGVVDVFSEQWFMAALKENGELVVWGDLEQSRLPEELQSGVVSIASNLRSGIALKEDGSIVTWPRSIWTDLYPEFIPEDELGNVIGVYPGHDGKFSLLNDQGTLHTWNVYGYYSTFLENTNRVEASRFARQYALITENGEVVSRCGSNLDIISGVGSPVTSIAPIKEGFAILRADGSLDSWQIINCTNELYSSAPSENVKSVVSIYRSFAAVMFDGSATSWGRIVPEEEIQSQLINVVKVLTGKWGFYFIKEDNEVVIVGKPQSSILIDDENIEADPLFVLNPPQ